MATLAIVKPGKIVREALMNSISLVEEARLLYGHKKFARANLLALLALEEASKARMIDDHHHDHPNGKLQDDLVNHKVKFGSKDRVTILRRHRVAFILEGNKNAGKDKELRENSMYVGARNMKVISPKSISAARAKINISRAKKEIYYFYLGYSLHPWPKYRIRLPEPPTYIKMNKT